MSANDISVTVIGGYLGAGKTTLVNHILRAADERVAVLVNDFGDINIDEDLIASQDGDTISLANGCICCSLVDGFASALATVTSLDVLPERLVIEASGVADPATVAAYGHAPGLVLDATIVVVDAETIRAKSRDKYVGDTVVRQLGSGDIVVLNKTDLVSASACDETRSWLKQTNPNAVVIDAINAQVDPALLFGVIPEPRQPAAHSGDDQHAGHGHADSLFTSWSWASDTPVATAQIEALMDSLPESVVRAKGVLIVSDDPSQPMVLQRVGQRWTLRPFFGTAPSQSRIVVIGLQAAADAIDEDWLHDQLSP